MNNLLKFPSIEAFKNVKRNVEWRAQFQGLDDKNEPIMDRLAKMPKIKFQGTVKLHGCNSGLIINPDNSFYCQSRERIISPQDDNYGFARFIHSLPNDVLENLYAYFHTNNPVAIYGEWAGKGIQAGVGINNIERSWFIFAARIIDESDLDKEDWQDIDILAGGGEDEVFNPNRIHVIDEFPKYEIEIDFERADFSVERLNELTLEVERSCPVAKQLGFEGIGEGIVWSPVKSPEQKQFNSEKFWFKVKGDKHSSSNVKKLANVDVEKLNNILEFIDISANEGRLNQGWEYLKEMKHPLEVASIGIFIKWVFNDILKEEKDVIEASGFKEKEIGGPIAKKSKQWYFSKLSKN